MPPVKSNRLVSINGKRAFLTNCVRFAAAPALLGWSSLTAQAAPADLRYFPVGTIYDYRWKLLDLALAHTLGSDGPYTLIPYAEDITQNRGVVLLETGAIEVIALGTNQDRESRLLPIRIDILRGIVGFRVFVIRAADQARIADMDSATFQRELVFGLNSQWADLPIMRDQGFSVTTSTSYENLFGMLAAGRFDAFPRGLNEARRELNERRAAYPQLAVESTRAIFFPFPIYFWVKRGNAALAQRIERGLNIALADGSFKNLFVTYHAAQIEAMKTHKRRVIRLDNTILPVGSPVPDTRWWWPESGLSG